MKHGIDAPRGLRYKLRMMGIPISSPSYIFGDNMSVENDTSRPESVSIKKSISFCYHAVHESAAIGESLVGHIPSKENVADLLTKSFMGKRGDIWSVMFFMIYMMTIINQYSQTRLHICKLDPMGNSINLEGTKKMQLYNYPD